MDATYPSQSQAWTRWLLACGIVGPAFFVVAFLIEGANRSSYSQLRDYVSELSLGTDGWIQTANFIACGWLVLAFAAGLARAPETGRSATTAPALFSILGLGLVGAGTFRTDPVGSAVTLHGDLHFLATIAIAVSLAVICLVLGSALTETWGLYSTATGLIVPGLFVLSNVASPVLLPGLVERAALILGAAWVALFATRTLRTT